MLLKASVSCVSAELRGATALSDKLMSGQHHSICPNVTWLSRKLPGDFPSLNARRESAYASAADPSPTFIT